MVAVDFSGGGAGGGGSAVGIEASPRPGTAGGGAFFWRDASSGAGFCQHLSHALLLRGRPLSISGRNRIDRSGGGRTGKNPPTDPVDGGSAAAGIGSAHLETGA